MSPRRTARPEPGRRRRLVGPALVAAALLVGGVACSGADEPAAGGTSTTAPAERDGGSGGSTPSTAAAAPGAGEGETTTTRERRELPTLDLAPDEQAYVDALLTQPTEGLEADQAACLAGHWIQIVGVDAARDAGVTPEGIQDGTQSVTDVPVDEATAERVVDAYGACDFDIVALVADGFTQAAEGDAGKVACIEDKVTDEVARRYLVLAIRGSQSDEGSPELFEMQRLIQPCLEAG